MIKRSIHILLGESHDRMMGYVGMQAFYYGQLCVKHEATSLLPLEINFLGKTYKFEEVARAMYGEGEENDDKMYVFPNDMDYLLPLIEAIHKVHPEFKIDILDPDDDDEESAESEEVKADEPKKSAFGSMGDEEGSADTTSGDEEEEDNSKYRYLLLTMPPVNKDQRKVYLDVIDAVYKYIMAKIDTEKVKLTARVAAKTAAYTKEDAEECKKAVDKVYKKNKDLADQQKDEKTKEVEDAYQRYLKEHPEDGGGQTDAGFGSNNKGAEKKQPTMPDDKDGKSDDDKPKPPTMPKAPDTPKNPLEGLGLGGGQTE